MALVPFFVGTLGEVNWFSIVGRARLVAGTKETSIR